MPASSRIRTLLGPLGLASAVAVSLLAFGPAAHAAPFPSEPLPADPGMTELVAGDFNHDGKKDLLAVQVSTGKLFLYPRANGKGLDTFGQRIEIGSAAWNGMRNLTVGDFDGDGMDDLVAVKKETGELFLYPGTKGKGLDTLGHRVLIGTGAWNGMNHLAADNSDGSRAGLFAVKADTGELFRYPNTGKPGTDMLGKRVKVSSRNWNGMNKLVPADGFDALGGPELIATETKTGKLFLFQSAPGPEGRMFDGPGIELGTAGWNGISDYAAGDFDGDSQTDLVAVASAPHETGKLYLYANDGSSGGFKGRVEIGAGGW
ncbi:FG-GAP-like repeat-containing protein [Streptomyces sp. NPDC002536]